MGEFASKGLAGTALGLGAGSLGLSLINGAGGLLNLMGGNNCAGNCAGNATVNRYELGLVQELAAKDAKIGLLEADNYTDKKIVEVYKDLQGQIKELAGEVRANYKEQSDINREQAVYNGVNTATVSCIKGQVEELLALAPRKIANDSVCPGWGNVTITPAASTTTTTPAA